MPTTLGSSISPTRCPARLGHPCSIGPTRITPATISSVLVNGSIPAPLLLSRKIQAYLRRSALLLSCFHPSRCAPRMKSLYRISDLRSRFVHVSRQLRFLRFGRSTNHFRRESIWQSQKRQRRQMPQGNCKNLFNMLRGDHKVEFKSPDQKAERC
jgi:hypothetical protein